MPEPSCTPAHLDPQEALQAVRDTEATRLANRLSSTYYCTDEMAAGLLADKVRAHRTIEAEDLPGLPEGTVFRDSRGYIHEVGDNGGLETLSGGAGWIHPAFPATVLMEAGDDL